MARELLSKMFDSKDMGEGVWSRFIWLRTVSGGAFITVIVI